MPRLLPNLTLTSQYIVDMFALISHLIEMLPPGKLASNTWRSLTTLNCLSPCDLYCFLASRQAYDVIWLVCSSCSLSNAFYVLFLDALTGFDLDGLSSSHSSSFLPPTSIPTISLSDQPLPFAISSPTRSLSSCHHSAAGTGLSSGLSVGGKSFWYKHFPAPVFCSVWFSGPWFRWNIFTTVTMHQAFFTGCIKAQHAAMNTTSSHFSVIFRINIIKRWKDTTPPLGCLLSGCKKSIIAEIFYYISTKDIVMC